jgi:deubiquitinase DESI2
MSFGRRRAAEPVFVNVYDLHASNDYVYSFGLGAYHSGVEVYGVEYSFGSGGGVFSHAPKVGSGANFRESIPLGETHLSEAGLWRSPRPTRLSCVFHP